MQDQISLAALRKAWVTSQQEVAEQMDTTQGAVLKLERSKDPQVSSLRRYVAALGRHLGRSSRVRIVAELGDDEYEIVLGNSGAAEVPPANALSSASRPAWRLRAWSDPALEQRFLDESFVAISGDDDQIGDFFARWPGDDAVRRRLERAFFPQRTDQAIGIFLRYWRDFRLEMQPGDVVVVPLVGRRAAIGEIVGDYEYAPHEADPRFRHRRRVAWLAVGFDRVELDADLRKVTNAPGTICRFGAPDAAIRLREIARS